MHNQVENHWSGRKQIRKISGVKPEQLEEEAMLGPLKKGMNREEKDKHNLPSPRSSQWPQAWPGDRLRCWACLFCAVGAQTIPRQ